MTDKIKDFIKNWKNQITEFSNKEIYLDEPSYYTFMQEVEYISMKHFPSEFITKIIEALNSFPEDTMSLLMIEMGKEDNDKRSQDRLCKHRLEKLFLILMSIERVMPYIDSKELKSESNRFKRKFKAWVGSKHIGGAEWEAEEK